MTREMISKILKDFTQLLELEQSPRTISYQFDKIAAMLSAENIRIDRTECKEEYEDGDLSLILSMKNEAITNGQYELASKFHFLEMELLMEKGNTKLTQLKIEPFYFEFKNDCIFFHFNKRKESQRLIANLIEAYNIVHQNPVFH